MNPKNLTSECIPNSQKNPANWRLPANVPAFQPISAKALQAKDFPPVPWIVDGLLPEGLTLFAGQPKIGKSWFVLDMMLCVAKGEPFQGRETSAQHCLYLALEDPEQRLKTRINALTNGEEASENLDIQNFACTSDTGLMHQLHDYMQKHPNTRLITIDTLQKVRGSKRNGETLYQADYREMTQLKQFADEFRISILVIHHVNKAKDEDDPFNRISGTNGILGAVDTSWVLIQNKRSDGDATLNVTGRDVESFDELLHFNRETFHWESRGDSAAFKRRSEREEYNRNPLVTALQKMVVAHPDGWEGNAADLKEECFHLLGSYPLESAKSYVPALKRLTFQLKGYDEIAVDTSATKGHQAWIRIWPASNARIA